ncbi:hypothetical protein FOA52_005365 [Chlamydomonas sp. UWO 241]|nr:hypothetical protein FOA52_005365 [Chlamydomonas sp. UWO 241]
MLNRGWDLQTVMQIVYTSIYVAHWFVALSFRRRRCSNDNGWGRAGDLQGSRAHSDAPAGHVAEASGRGETAPAPAATPAPGIAATGVTSSSATPAQGALSGGGRLHYRSVVPVNTSVVEFVTKFPSLHLSQYPQLSTPEGVAALRERLELRASAVISRMRGEAVDVRLAELNIAAGCIVVGGRWHLQGAGGASEEEQRAFVEEVLLEEMLQEVDPAPEGMRTPCSVLDSTSEMWQLGSDADAEPQPEQPTLHVETGAQARTRVSPPSLERVPLLATMTPLQALPLHNGGHDCVSMQFATHLLARALGRDPELVVSFAPPGGAGTPAPTASLLRARIVDLQTAARARGNPPGLMDVDIHFRGALAGAAREYGGVLVVQLVDGPTMLAALPVLLLPGAARPAVVELSRLGLDVRTASHVARDLGLLLLAPHATCEPPHARLLLMRDAARLLMQWARQAHLPATLALLDSAVAQMDAADAPQPPRTSAARPSAWPIASAVQSGSGGAPAADRNAGGSAGAVKPSGANAGAPTTGGPTALWCWVNVLVALACGVRSAFEDGLGHVFLGSATTCVLYTLPFIVTLVVRARPALLARLPRWLIRADASLLRRLYNLLHQVVCIQAFGHVLPGASLMLRTGMDIPLLGVLDFGEPLDVRVWWVRAALSVVLSVPLQVLMMCAGAGQEGGKSVCTRQAWGVFTNKVDLAAFLAPRVAFPFVANAAIWLGTHGSGLARWGQQNAVAAAARVVGALEELEQKHAAEMKDAGLAHAGAIEHLEGQAAAVLAVALAQQGQAAAAHEAGALDQLAQQHTAEMEDAGLAHASAIVRMQGLAAATLAGALDHQDQAAAAHEVGALDQLAQQHTAEMKDAGLAHASAIVQLQGLAAAALATALDQQGRAAAVLASTLAQKVTQQVATAAGVAGAFNEQAQQHAAEMEDAGLVHAVAIEHLEGQAAAALAVALAQQGQAAAALADALAQKVRQHAVAVQVAAAAHEVGALHELAQQHATEMENASLVHAGAIGQLEGQAAAALATALAQQGRAAAELAGTLAQKVQQHSAAVQVATAAHEAGALVELAQQHAAEMKDAGLVHAVAIVQLEGQAAAALAVALAQQGQAAVALAGTLAQKVTQHAVVVQLAAAAHEAGALDEQAQQHAAALEDAALAHAVAIVQLEGQAAAALAVALAQQGQAAAALAGALAQKVQLAAAAHKAGALVELVQQHAAEMEATGLAHAGAIRQLKMQAALALGGARN